MEPFRIRQIGAILVFFGASLSAADRVLIDCPPHLRHGMTDWVAWREGQGHTVAFVSSTSAPESQGPPRLASSDSTHTILLLIGDGLRSGVAPNRSPASVIVAYGPEATIATDHPHALAHQADVVARLPFNDPDSLRRFLSRSIQRQEATPTWGATRLQVVAGVGGFSTLIDAAIEGSAKRLLGELTPEHVRISLRRVGEPRASAGVGRTQPAEGGVWVWLGHGLRDRLPGVAAEEVGSFTNGADVAVLLACYTGDVEAPGACVVERLLESANGPIAVIAASRVSMPYGNARLGAELLTGLGTAGAPSIAECFGAARRDSLDDSDDPRLRELDALAKGLGASAGTLRQERWEHAQMYHLFGDPLAAADRSLRIELSTPELGAAGSVCLRGIAPIGGRLTAEFLRAPTDVDTGPKSGRWVRPGEDFNVELARPYTGRGGLRKAWVGIQGADSFAGGARSVRFGRGRTSDRLAK